MKFKFYTFWHYYYFIILPRVNVEKDELLIKNAELSEKLEKIKHLNSLQASSPESIAHVRPKHSPTGHKPTETDDQMESVSKDYLKGLRDELSEKNKVNQKNIFKFLI